MTVEVLARRITNAPEAAIACGAARNEDDRWEPPIELGSGIALPPFPVDALPTWLAEFVRAVAQSTQTPIDLPGVLALSVLATSVGNRGRVRIRADWFEPLGLYTAVALDPASRKSAVFSMMKEPLDEAEKRERKRLEPEIAKLTARKDSLQKEIAQCERQLARAAADRAPELRERRDALRAELEGIVIPVPRKCYVDDITSEKLASVIEENGGSVGLLAAEGGGPFAMMAGRYSDGEANFDVYLKGHAGDTLKVHRVGRPETVVYRPVLSLGLALQPDVLRSLAQNRSMRGRGLLGRFLYALPHNTVGSRMFDAPPVPTELLAEYAARIGRLLEMKEDEGPDGEARPHVLAVSPEAYAVIRALAVWIEPQLTGELASMKDWAGKLVGHAARIAALFHIAEHATRARAWDELTISGETAERAVRVARYFIPHALAAFEQMEITTEGEGARAIAAWIKRHSERWLREGGLAAFSRADVYRDLRRGCFKDPSHADAPLELLVQHRIIRRMTTDLARQGPGKKPSPRFEVNPLFLPRNTRNPHEQPGGGRLEDYGDIVAGGAES